MIRAPPSLCFLHPQIAPGSAQVHAIMSIVPSLDSGNVSKVEPQTSRALGVMESDSDGLPELPGQVSESAFL